MSDGDVAGASRPTRRLTILSTLLWAFLALAVPLAALTLNVVHVAGFPLGFWFAAQGSLMGLAGLAVYFTWRAGGDHGREGIFAPLAFAGECIASAGFIGFAGLIAQIGFDALSYPLGLTAGLALMSILFAPRYVLYPGRSISTFCSSRFEGPWPRLLVLAIIAIASVFLLAADIRGLGLAIQALVGFELSQALAAAATLLCLVWLAVAMREERQRPRGLVYGALLVAFSTPLVMMALFQHRLPLPYWSYGFALQDVATLEQGLIGQKLADFRALKPLTSPFLQLSNWNFAGIVLAVAFGIAALPQFLGRHLSQSVVKPGEAVRRATITTALVALFLCGLAPFAAFTRAAIAGFLQTGVKVNALPPSITAASARGWLDVCGAGSGSTADLAAACAKVQGHKGLLRLQDLTFGTDSYLFAAAKVSGIEGPLWLLLVLGALTAGLAGGHAILAGFIAAEADARRAPVVEPSAAVDVRGISIGVALLLAAVALAAFARADLPSLAAEGLALIAASIFPCLLLALYWRRFNAPGAVATLLTGFLCAGLYIVGVRLLPVMLLDVSGSWSNAPPAAMHRFHELESALAAATDAAARAEAQAQLHRHATVIANWWGLKPAAFVLIAIPAAIAAGVVTTILTSARQQAAGAGDRP